jgi:hypothetical protein
MFESKRLSLLLTALLAGGALALAGCPGPGGNGEDACEGVTCGAGETCEVIDGAAECVADEEPECTSDADCTGDTLECREGQCVEKCLGQQCAVGQVCEPTTGNCVTEACTNDAQCPGEQICREGECGGGLFANCAVDDCAPGYSCEQTGTNSVCIQQCTESSDCTTDMHCVDNLCGYNVCNPRATETCTEDTDCEGDEACLDIGIGQGYCLAPCTDDDTCDSGFCIPNEDEVPADLRERCYPLIAQKTDYYGTCDAHGTGDGRCLGPLDTENGDLGLCVRTGGVAHGSQGCNPDQMPAAFGGTESGAPATQCDGYCADTGGGTICLGWCSLFDGACGPITGFGPTACEAIFGGQGICFIPQEDIGSDEGDVCTYDPEAGVACFEPYVCAPDNGGETCQVACETQALEDAPGDTCAEGETCESLGLQNNPYLGFCHDPA